MGYRGIAMVGVIAVGYKVIAMGYRVFIIDYSNITNSVIIMGYSIIAIG